MKVTWYWGSGKMIGCGSKGKTGRHQVGSWIWLEDSAGWGSHLWRWQRLRGIFQLYWTFYNWDFCDMWGQAWSSQETSRGEVENRIHLHIPGNDELTEGEEKGRERPKRKKKTSLQAYCFEDEKVLDGIQCCREMNQMKMKRELWTWEVPPVPHLQCG